MATAWNHERDVVSVQKCQCPGEASCLSDILERDSVCALVKAFERCIFGDGGPVLFHFSIGPWN